MPDAHAGVVFGLLQSRTEVLQRRDRAGVVIAADGEFAVFALYGVFAASMRTQVIGRPRVMTWLRRAFAGTYVLLAGRLAFESR